MNCQQTKELLPLYAGRDLDARRERLARAHLGSCLACCSAAGEYSESRQLLQHYVPPVFSEDACAEIRQNVWRQIERGSTTRSSWETFVGLFRPRPVWALAAGVLIFAMLFGIYLVANRSTGPQQIAGKDFASNPRLGNPEPPPPKALLPPGDSKENRGARQFIASRPIHQPPRHLMIERNSTRVSVNAPAAKTEKSSGANSAAQFDLRSDLKPADPLRMEIQTRNPNIRIIWFTQKEPKPAPPNSKGI